MSNYFCRGKPIMIVKQVNYSDKARRNSVPWTKITDWFERAQEKMARLKYTTHYDIVYVFITNRRVLGMPKTIQLGLAVVCDQNFAQYFGKSVAPLFA